MKWVLLFFCVIFGLVFMTVLLIICSTIRLNIAKLNISNLGNGVKKKLEKDIQIFLELYLFGKIKMVKVKLDNDVIDKLKNKINFNMIKFKNLRRDRKILKKTNLSKILQILKPKFKNTDLDLQLGTEEVMTTVFIVTFISSIFGILFRSSSQKKVSFKVMPLYHIENSINFHLNCIIEVKMVHIIHVIFLIAKKGMIKDERASNRRSYDYSYE